MSELRYGVDDRPSHVLSAALGLQTVALIVTGIVLVPVIVLRAAGSDLGVSTWAIFAALFVSGLTTVVQARPIGVVGAGYLLFMGTSGAYLAVATTAVEAGGLPLLATLVVVSSAVEFLLARRLSILRRVLTPTVGGTVVMLIAVAVFDVCFGMLTSIPDDFAGSSWAGPATASATFVTVLGISIFSGPRLRLWAPLIGIAVGCTVATGFGLMDLRPVAAAPWFGLPRASWPGFDLSFDGRFFTLLPSFFVVTIIGAIETYGDGIAIQRVSAKEEEPVDFRAVQGALNADGLGNLLSGLLGTLPNTTYSTSISVVEMTGVAARRVGVYGGLALVGLAFLPKFSALLQAVPDPVSGAYVLILIVLLFAHGLRLVTEGGLSYENGLVVCLSFWVGMGFQQQLIFRDHLPEMLRTLLDNGMTSGGIVAVALTMLVSLKNRSVLSAKLAPSTKSLAELQELAQKQAVLLGWDPAAVQRLQLAAEEALLFLVEREASIETRKPMPIQVRARDADGMVELEFATGPDAENLERRMTELGTGAEREPDHAGLHILRAITNELHHAQFHDRSYLLIRVDSRPLG